ncbi:MAG: glucose-6-phosphate isomerase, archaeal [Clostridiales bacterium]|jgi:glucose-6-phosphate isomerase|nr:glucose-6-phosphate isomerase, archaeal [Clostridiales bacterium]
MSQQNNINPFTIYFSLNNGLSDSKKSLKRYLSDMKGMYLDEEALNHKVQQENSLVYEFYDLGMPETAGDLAFGTSITYPGKVGDEYFMTKGHFHTILDTAEVYYCIAGRGYMLMENPEGEWNVQELTPGKAVYVPKRFAHRSVNIGSEPFITFFTFRADAGHDYGTIESKGFRKLIVERDGKPEIIDNPKWK